MDPFIGQIMQVGFRYAPVNWLTCNGAPLQISQNQALYALLGNTFGGTQNSTFCLPDARGRTFIGTGSGPGLTPRLPGGRAVLRALRSVSRNCLCIRIMRRSPRPPTALSTAR
jgi:microcystin-dependent protein